MMMTVKREPAAKRRRSQAGQAMIEGSLVFLTLICMILFVVDIGRLLFYKHYFTERAQVGARWASVNSQNATNVKNVVCYNATTGSGQGFLGLSPSNVSVTYDDANNIVTVTVSGFQTIKLIPFIAGNYTIPAATVSLGYQSMGATT